MKSLLSFLLVCAIGAVAEAKPSQPMDGNLTLTGLEIREGVAQYSLLLEFRPWNDTTRASFHLKLPPNFVLEQGFQFWEGPLKSNVVFVRTFIITAPLEGKGLVELSAEISLERENKSAQVFSLDLNRQSNLQKAEGLDPGASRRSRDSGISRR